MTKNWEPLTSVNQQFCRNEKEGEIIVTFFKVTTFSPGHNTNILSWFRPPIFHFHPSKIDQRKKNVDLTTNYVPK